MIELQFLQPKSPFQIIMLGAWLSRLLRSIRKYIAIEQANESGQYLEEV